MFDLVSSPNKYRLVTHVNKAQHVADIEFPFPLRHLRLLIPHRGAARSAAPFRLPDRPSKRARLPQTEKGSDPFLEKPERKPGTDHAFTF